MAQRLVVLHRLGVNMASAQEPGLVEIFIEKPNGNRYLVLSKRTEELGPGGAPDHVVSANTEKWRFLPKGGGVIDRGDKMVIMLTTDGADGIDVSDCVFSIPVTNLSNGLVETLTDGKFTMSDVTCPAGTQLKLAEYEFTAGNKQFGGGYIGLFIEDDT